jgi:hypothetical protein
MTTPTHQAVEAAEREKFEAWFLREKKGTLPDLQMEGEWYYWLNTAQLWDAWSSRAALALPQEVAAEVGQPFDLEEIIDRYVDDYEMHAEDDSGREGYYSPNDHEKHLLKDAIMGMLADPDWDEAWGKHIAALAASRPPAAGVAGGVEADLQERCREIIQWQDTGILPGQALRALADQIGEDDGGHSLQRAESKTAREALEIIAATQAQPSPHPAVGGSGGDVKAKYDELIYSVGNKWPGETRHQTTLRYIKQAETGSREPNASKENP